MILMDIELLRFFCHFGPIHFTVGGGGGGGRGGGGAPEFVHSQVNARGAENDRATFGDVQWLETRYP